MGRGRMPWINKVHEQGLASKLENILCLSNEEWGRWGRVFSIGKREQEQRKVKKDLWEMSSALLPPQGHCAQSSQVCIDIPTDLCCGKSDIIFILVEFLMCSNLERKKKRRNLFYLLDWCDPSLSVTGHWQNVSLNLWTIFLCQFFGLIKRPGNVTKGEEPAHP